MKQFLTDLRGAVVSTLVFAVVLCAVYPLAVWAIGRTAFRSQADGSLIPGKDGSPVGSALLGQGFTSPRYFHPRPSAAGANGYDAAGSGGSNLGPSSEKLAGQIRERVAAYRTVNGLAENASVPADAVTASASGLDPHISPRNAALQADRVARERRLVPGQILGLIRQHTEGPDLGIFGDAGVNVLKLNLALDALR